uniref:IQ motif containing K n=1 Tax=Naja naja TaxID=35670 RepID=A0A8C6XXE9_NAJNA
MPPFSETQVAYNVWIQPSVLSNSLPSIVYACLLLSGIFTKSAYFPQQSWVLNLPTPRGWKAESTLSMPREFLECYIFPVLLPGMVELLHEAKKQRCFERKQTRFIALDFLTEWLYNHNTKRRGEPFVEFFEIPFVKDWLKDHPRPPIPLSLLLTEKDASHIIQTFWKGYRVRCDPEVQELRQWQKHLRETKNIHKRVREFWANQEKKDSIGPR